MCTRFWKRTIFFIVYTLFILLLVEIHSRAFLSLRKKAPFFSPKAVVYAFYPELREAKQKQIKKEDEYLDILILGASVVNDDWGNIGPRLQKKLENKTKRKVRVHNVSARAQNSLDSYYKYRYLADKEFDMVLFYHAINEVQTNNSPPEKFKADYSHYAWYKVVNLFEKYRKFNFITFPYTAYYVAIKVMEKLNISSYLSADYQKKEWVKYGNEIKSEDSFRENLTNIMKIAARKKEPVLLMNFAYYVPENYRPEQYKNKILDRGGRACSLEVWGEPENVVKGVETHNKIIEEIALLYQGKMPVNQNKLIPKDERHFGDIAHLTDKGCEKFVDNILEVIIEETHLDNK